MASRTVDEIEAEDLNFKELGPQDNAASRTLLHMCKMRPNEVNRMEDYWNAMLASYFPLREGFMVCRKDTQGFRVLTVAAAREDDILELRVLLHVIFSDNEAAEDPPFNDLCKVNFHDNHATEGIVCMTMGATTYRPMLMLKPDLPGNDCWHTPLSLRLSDVERIEFGYGFYRMDVESDRKMLDQLFRTMHKEGLWQREDNAQEDEDDEEETPREQHDETTGDEPDATDLQELGNGDTPGSAVDSTTNGMTETFPAYEE